MSKLIAHSSWFVAKTAKILLATAAFLFFTTNYELPATCAEKWQGVDESVVEKYAAENGRASRAPLINTDQGDLLLFVFLLAGTVGGFAAGYYWRMLVGEKSAEADRSNKE